MKVLSGQICDKVKIEFNQMDPEIVIQSIKLL